MFRFNERISFLFCFIMVFLCTSNYSQSQSSDVINCYNQVWDVAKEALYCYEVAAWEKEGPKDQLSLGSITKTIFNSDGSIAKSYVRDNIFEEEERKKLQLGENDRVVLSKLLFQHDQFGRGKIIEIKSREKEIPIVHIEYTYPDEETIEISYQDFIIGKRSQHSIFKISDCRLKTYDYYDHEGNLGFRSKFDISNQFNIRSTYYKDSNEPHIEEIKYNSFDEHGNWEEKTINTKGKYPSSRKSFRFIIYEDLPPGYNSSEALVKGFTEAISSGNFSEFAERGIAEIEDYLELTLSTNTTVFDTPIATSIRKDRNFFSTLLIGKLKKLKAKHTDINWNSIQTSNLNLKETGMGIFKFNLPVEISFDLTDGTKSIDYTFYAYQFQQGWKYFFLK